MLRSSIFVFRKTPGIIMEGSWCILVEVIVVEV